MNLIYEVTGNKFDFLIKPFPSAFKNAELWWLPDFYIMSVDGRIYLMCEKKFGIGKGIRVKKKDFYTEVFNMFFEPTESDMRKFTLSDLRVAINTYPTSVRSLYLNYVHGKYTPETD